MHEQQQRAKSSKDERGGGRSSRKDNSRKKRPEEGRTDTGARRVIVELGNLERALTKGDFVLEQAPLQEILRTLRSMRLSSLEQLEPNARGRLITSLFRVMRQKKPALWDAFLKQTSTEGEAAATEQQTPAQQSAKEAACVQPESSPEELPDATQEASAALAPSEEAASTQPESPQEASTQAPQLPVELASADTTQAAQAQQESPSLSPEQVQAQAYRSALELVGRIWRALGEKVRAQAALEASGLKELSEEAPLAPEPAKKMPERSPKDKRREKSPRVDSRSEPRVDSRADSRANSRAEARMTFKDWKEQAAYLEQTRKTRDAGRLHEKNASFAQAVRLFELGNDLKSALRCAVLGEMEEDSTRLMSRMPSADVKFTLERLSAWGLLMSYCAKTKDYEAVARLYERARQMDQAALAWEKAGRLSLARKAYEQAGDAESAKRTRATEVQQLLDRGDRLGAATLLVAAGDIPAAVDTLKGLPGPKAYRFLLKLKLEEEAQKLATTHIEQAIAAQDHVAHAHWLEAFNKLPEAIEAWLQAGRRDKAMYLCEKTEKYEQAAQLAEALGRLDKAEALFLRAGNKEQAAKIAALVRSAVVPTEDSSSMSESQASEVM